MRQRGFTLIELLVVIAIIAVLAGLAFPVLSGVFDRAKKVQAKNDLNGLVVAANAYYTEYGKYPLPSAAQGNNEDYTYSYDGSVSPSNADLVKALQGDPSGNVDNPKQIVFLTASYAKNAAGYGVQPVSASKPYEFRDPWGQLYSVCIDSDYNGKVRERGTGTLLSVGVITWSLGRDADWNKSGIPSWK